MKGSKPGFLYEIILNSNSNLAELISTLKLRLPDPQIYYFQNINFYIFIETLLERPYVCQSLADIISEDFIFQITMPKLNNETILYYTFIPTVFKDFNAFAQYVSSFVNSFKPINLVPGTVYCVKCDNIYDATRLIAISQAIDFPGETYTKMFVDTYLLNMPIVQILNRNIDIATIERFAHSKPEIFQDFGDSKILVFSDLLLAEKVIDIFNGGLFNATFLIARHFADDSIINELQKYEVKFSLINNSSLLNQEERSHKKMVRMMENLKIAFNIAKTFGRVFSISCHTKQSNSEKYALVVFQNKASAIRMVEQNVIPTKFNSLSFFISTFSPRTTEKDVMALYSDIQPSSIIKYRLKIQEEQQETYFLPFEKLKFESIEKVEQALERNKTIKFPHYQPFWFRRKEDFVNCYESMTSKTSLFISNISNECTLDSLLEKCAEYGTIRFIAFTKTIKTDSILATRPTKLGFALVTYSKPNDMQHAKTQLNQLVFYGNHLNVKIPAGIPKNDFYFENSTKIRSGFPLIGAIPFNVFKSVIPLLREEIPDFAKKKS